MRSFVKHTAIFLSIFLVVGCFPDRAALAADESIGTGEDTDRFVWQDDLDQARLLARAQERPLLIVFRCEP